MIHSVKNPLSVISFISFLASGAVGILGAFEISAFSQMSVKLVSLAFHVNTLSLFIFLSLLCEMGKSRMIKPPSSPSISPEDSPRKQGSGIEGMSASTALKQP